MIKFGLNQEARAKVQSALMPFRNVEMVIGITGIALFAGFMVWGATHGVSPKKAYEASLRRKRGQLRA